MSKRETDADSNTNTENKTDDKSNTKTGATARNNADAAPAHNGKSHAVTRFFDHFAAHVTKWAGSPIAFGSALIAVVVWAATGPMFGYSETWQLVINTGTTIVTFLMVFLIQQSQNKDGRALHLKLDELLIALKGADEELVDVEQLDEDKLIALAAACTARAQAQARSDRSKKRRAGGAAPTGNADTGNPASRRPRSRSRKPIRSSLRVRRSVLRAGRTAGT